MVPILVPTTVSLASCMIPRIIPPDLDGVILESEIVEPKLLCVPVVPHGGEPVPQVADESYPPLPAMSKNVGIANAFAELFMVPE